MSSDEHRAQPYVRVAPLGCGLTARHSSAAGFHLPLRHARTPYWQHLAWYRFACISSSQHRLSWFRVLRYSFVWFIQCHMHILFAPFPQFGNRNWSKSRDYELFILHPSSTGDFRLYTDSDTRRSTGTGTGTSSPPASAARPPAWRSLQSLMRHGPALTVLVLVLIVTLGKSETYKGTIKGKSTILPYSIHKRIHVLVLVRVMWWIFPLLFLCTFTIYSM